MKGFYTVEDLASIYNVTKETIRRWARKGKIKGERVSKFWYFPKKEFKA